MILLQWLLVFSMLHDYYVSVTNINYSKKNGSLEITLKVFSDDLEKAIKARTGETLNLLGDELHPKTDSLVFDYIMDCNDYFVNQNQSPAMVQFIGSETDKEAFWCYLEIRDVTNFSKLKVRSRLLIEIFDRQTNLVFVKAHNQEKGMMMHAETKVDSVVFN